MFTRSTNYPASTRTNPHSCFPQQTLSPQPLLNKYTPKSPYRHLPKNSSLSSKTPALSIPPQNPSSSTLLKNPSAQSPSDSLNQEYFPQNKSNRLAPAANRIGLERKEGRGRELRDEACRESSEDFDLLPLDSNTELKNEQESFSTESSKGQKYSMKEVRFGGVIPEAPKAAPFLKKEKMRSPSILKKSKGSPSLSHKSRSCSVASGKERRQKEQQRNQHSTNQAIRQKYNSIVSQLQTQHQGKAYRSPNKFTSGATYNSHRTRVPSQHKYTDDIFPPVYSSLFCLKKGKSKHGADISWARLSSLFEGCQLVLGRSKQVQVYRQKDSFCSEALVSALNAVGASSQLLERVFEGQGINPYGIYLVKIFQEHSWKYVIVDDFIPVNADLRPAFLRVRPREGTVDIWPFLLEKAYANYYSSYQALTHGNPLDFIQQISGTPSFSVQLKPENNKKLYNRLPAQKQAPLARASRLLKTGNYLALGEGNQSKMAPLVYSIFNKQLSWHDPADQFTSKRITFEQLPQMFTKIHLLAPFQHSSSSFHPLRKPSRTSQPPSADLFPDEPPILRSFKVEAPGEYCLSIRQKDRRFFHFKEGHGDYIWLRAIILQKEFDDNGFRWTAGEYACQKTLSFTQHFESGQYYLLLQCEWEPMSAGELSLVFSGPEEVVLKRQVYREEDRMIEKGCLDLAQRFGELIQINKFICSYNYLSETGGLIIQNIVNERVTGKVSVIRSIRGLKCQSEILPVNRQFYKKVERAGKTWLKLSEQIELDIREGEHYTVVLKMKKGIDRKFFRTFDFGC